MLHLTTESNKIADNFVDQKSLQKNIFCRLLFLFSDPDGTEFEPFNAGFKDFK